MSKFTRKLTAMISAVAMMASLALPAWAVDDMVSVKTEPIDIQPYFEKARDEFYTRSRTARANGETLEPMYTTVVDQDGNEYDLQVFELDEAIAPVDEAQDESVHTKTVVYSLEEQYIQPRDLQNTSSGVSPNGGVYGYVTVRYVTKGSEVNKDFMCKLTGISGAWEIQNSSSSVTNRTIEYVCSHAKGNPPSVRKTIQDAPMSFNMPITSLNYYPADEAAIITGGTRATVRQGSSSWTFEVKVDVVRGLGLL